MAISTKALRNTKYELWFQSRMFVCVRYFGANRYFGCKTWFWARNSHSSLPKITGQTHARNAGNCRRCTWRGAGSPVEAGHFP
jgi:hypothetical protein